MYNDYYRFYYRDVISREFVILNKTFDENWNTTCLKWVPTELCMWEPVVLLNPLKGYKYVCKPGEGVPKSVKYDCIKKRITNLIVLATYSFDSSKLSDFQKPENYSCFTDIAKLNEAGRRYEQQIIPNAVLTTEMLEKAQYAASQYLVDVLASCQMKINLVISTRVTVISDWKEVK